MYEDVDTAELREDYRRNLEEATEEFNSWPAWKQSVLERAVSASNGGSVPDLEQESNKDTAQQNSP